MNGPRTIDIDILLYSRQIIATEELRFRTRVFASEGSCWRRWRN